MKVHELLGSQTLFEDVTLQSVESLDDLKDIDSKTIVNVTGNVDLYGQNLKKLPVKFGIVDGYFTCNKNSLTSLKGSPQKAHKRFDCGQNDLNSLEDAPQEVGGYFSCSFNEIESLEGIHKIIKKMNGRFYCRGNPIERGGIGLLLIEGFVGTDETNIKAFDIINKYVGQGKKGLLLCQEELIENGYEEYAKL